MFDLQQFVVECQDALASEKPVQVIEALVKQAIADPPALRDAFKDGEGVDRSGPIGFAHRDDRLSVANIVTPPGLLSPPHNHKMWAVIGVYDGQELNRFFRYEDGELHEQGERLLEEGDVTVLGAEAIHSIANPLLTESAAIHVYGGDLVGRSQRSMWNPHTRDCEAYEMGQLMAWIGEISSPTKPAV